MQNYQSSRKDFDDKNCLIMQPCFQDMFKKLKYKQDARPELGRILRDKRYDKVDAEEKEVALWAFVKTERLKELARMEEERKAKVKPVVTFNS